MEVPVRKLRGGVLDEELRGPSAWRATAMEVRGPAGKQWVCWIEGWRSPAAALSGVVKEAVRSARAGWREGQQRRREDSARVTQGGLEGAEGSEG